MTISSFAVTWDYRCPFARNAHEHVVVALQAGAEWDVEFVPFSLNQVHVQEGGTDVWDDPAAAPSLLAMQVGIVVRDKLPGQFLEVHCALFLARHDEARDLREEAVLREILAEHGVDGDVVFAHIADGWPLEVFRKEHERAAGDHKVWGVPTFIAAEQSVFVRLMHRPTGDAALARTTVERVLDLVGGWPDLNEFKHTSISR